MTLWQDKMTESKEELPGHAKKYTYHFGEKLRSAREKKKMTLKAVAGAAGVSESLVSQIEHNKVSPAIDTLLALVSVLDLNLEYLFEEYRRERPVVIIRNGERRSAHEGKVVFEEVAQPCAEDGQNALESYVITLPPGAFTSKGNYGHSGREVGLVLEGGLTVHYDGREYQLYPGDSVSFSSVSPHTLENKGDVLVRAVWIVSPAQRFVD
ncbi:MAG: cupin domain-containing protein [Treponema sp.]|nr:cupin domain-containing protein [Treponema sp.]HBB43483.1 XRE family transcriptional regulator [Treponema sp.]